MIRTLLLDGIGDLRAEYGLVLADADQVLNAPPYKEYLVDVPGADGQLDITDSIWGDVRYDLREQSLKFFVMPENVGDYERLKTRIFNHIHGRAFDFQFTFDPEYTYHGRISVKESQFALDAAFFIFEFKTDPYKTAEDILLYANAANGATFILPSGRKRVSPIFETEWPTYVEFEGVTYILPPGTNSIRDLWLRHGNNEIYVNSFIDGGRQTWVDLQNLGVTWAEFATKRVIEWRWGNETSNEVRNVYIKYARKDL